MVTNTFCRLEKKILIPSNIVPGLMERISSDMKPDAYNKGGKPYEICNLYFDDEGDDIIRDSINKPKYKCKVRMRSYGTPDMNSKVFIELKQKLDGVGTKRRATMPLRDMIAYVESGKRPEGLSFINSQVLNEIDYFRAVHPCQPKVYVSYLRNAYFSKTDPDFRVTFDSEILTRREDVHLESGRYGRPVLPEGVTLLEVKFAGAVPLWFCHVMSDFNLHFGTYSKVGADFKRYHKEAAAASGADVGSYRFK